MKSVALTAVLFYAFSFSYRLVAYLNGRHMTNLLGLSDGLYLLALIAALVLYVRIYLRHVR